ncbi:hypothetical protein BU24DRAFT_496284 [Aaosphaeria arxii CBS 175.79]|uniref:N-acetyltransferase domain-containing protein n=1 Tax=Aaosphaeria arxii CBS 175.79 TaxID=1450172 RepID=A0A6A5XE71_9PLEO|nr:uncharacterized protein BU24DRAFT_496284 [Aaosphaeria arxii CBS 175.79]KAF2011171.1 hypothetical protein BU24DRAFT_496284 [Aaosphaeria arxii CBS 175.79]
MTLKLSVVQSATDFDKIAPMDHDAWKIPYNPQLKHFRPQFPTREQAIAYARENSKCRFEDRDPEKQFWLKVEDENEEVIGAAQWAVNIPAEGAERTVASWYPEGSEEREFAERFINGLWGFLGERVTRPHMVVHVEHRYRGAGRMLIKWGTAKADELGIETVISSLHSARGAYEKSGLGYIEEIPPSRDLEVENPSAKWKELQADDLSGCLMWRPVGRDFVVGEDKAPWQE